jgi:hypothetical protein
VPQGCIVTSFTLAPILPAISIKAIPDHGPQIHHTPSSSPSFHQANHRNLLNMTTSVVPGFYHFFFTWFDPIVAFSGAVTDFVSPDFVINSLVPKTLRNEEGCNPNYKFIFQQAGGGMIAVAFLSGALLRATNDLKVWKYVQAAILLIDIATLYSVWDALRLQSRLQVSTWRGEDWGCVGLTTFVTVLRVAFLAEAGFRKRGVKAD